MCTILDEESREFLYLFGETPDRDFFAITEIDDLSRGFGTIRQLDERIGDISYMTERTGLLTIPIHSNVLALQGLIYETRDNHTILACLSRANGIEKSGTSHG